MGIPNTQIQNVKHAASTLSEMSEQLDADIARVAVSCAQAEDESLMKELSETIPDGHSFKDCVRYMWMAMKKPETTRSKSIASAPAVKEGVVSLLRELTDITYDLGGESRARMDLVEMLVRYLPNDRILDFLLEMENHHRECVADGRNYGPVPDDSDIFSRLSVLRLKAADL